MIKGVLYLKLCDVFDEERFTLLGDSYDYDYSITCVLDENSNLDDVVSNKNRKELLSAIKGSLEFLDEKDDSLLLRTLERCQGREMELIRMCKDIRFDERFSIEDIASLLRHSTFLKSKRIVIKCDGIFDEEYTSSLEREFSEFRESVVFKIPLNEHYISLEELKMTVFKIKSITQKIKSLPLSPLEQIMYAYDMVRDREFKREDGEDKRASRDLTSVLFGDSIVCEGFSNEFKAILDNLDFKTSSQNLMSTTDSSRGHRRVAVYVKDEKYDVDGVYFFDMTWDSKRNSCDYLNYYRFFGLTKEQFEEFQNGKWKDLTFGDFGYDLVEEFKKYCQEGKLNRCPKRVINRINRATSLVYGRRVLPSTEIIKNPLFTSILEKLDLKGIIKDAEETVDLFDRILPADILYRVLFNTRKVEYYENPSKYVFDEETICQIVKNSKWVYDSTIDDIVLVLLGAKTNVSKDLTHEQLVQNGLDKTIALVKLTRTLKDINEKRL